MNQKKPSGTLNLTLAGMLATFENKSNSQTAAAAVQMATQMARAWQNVYDFGVKVRADQSRPELEREHLLAQLGQRQVASISPGVEKAMLNLTTRRDTVQSQIDSTFKEADTLAAMKGSEARAYLRTLTDGQRFDALADQVLAKAAASAPARLSNLNDGQHDRVRQDVAMRERPQEMAELQDLGHATDMLLMASDSLVKNIQSFTHAEVMRTRVEAPSDQAAA